MVAEVPCTKSKTTDILCHQAVPKVLYNSIYTASKKSSHPHISEFDLASNFFRLWELGACYFLIKFFFFTETTQNYLTNHVKMEYTTFFSAEES